MKSNKKNAIAFYRMAYNGLPRKAVENYVGKEYIQHNPLVGDGKEPFIAYFERMAHEYPDKSIEFVGAIVQDDLVALHTHQMWPDNEQYVTMDFFRFDANGKIVEHWDAIQRIPIESAKKIPCTDTKTIREGLNSFNFDSKKILIFAAVKKFHEKGTLLVYITIDCCFM